MENDQKKKSLKERILEEMTVDYSEVLGKYFSLAKQFIRLTEEGEVEVLVKDRVTGKESILLYLIGKLYAKEAGLVSSEEVGNEEFLRNLGMPTGSLLPWLKSLRDEKKIRQDKRNQHTYHTIRANLVDAILEQIRTKLEE